MKNISKSYLPDNVTHNKKLYSFLTGVDSYVESKDFIIQFAKAKGYSLIQVNSLSKNLKGRLDLHGREYKPLRYLFCSPEMSTSDKEEMYEKIRLTEIN